MDQSEIAAAVQEFEAAQARGEYFPRAWFDRLTLDDAYRILLALTRRRGGGSHRIGWKVGLTARAIQQQEHTREVTLLERLVEEPEECCLGPLWRQAEKAEKVEHLDRMNLHGRRGQQH
jgi:hypothetical protein